MFEYNGAEFFSQTDRDMAEIADLKARIDLLENNLAFANSRVQTAEDKASRAVNEASDFAQRLGDLRELFQEILEQEDSHSAKELWELFERPFERLGVSITREINIEITVTWRGTIDLPIGVDVDDLDVDDFDICAPSHNDYNSDISDYFHYSDVRER